MTSDMDQELFGICLSSETHLQEPDKDISLGILSCSATTTLSQCRDILEQQCQFLPTQYSFIAARGWPVSKSQEGSIRLHQIKTDFNALRIQKDFGQRRVGISTTDGLSLGFIFIDISSNVHGIRDAIDHQIRSHRTQGTMTYRLVDRNGWPVSPDQEDALSVVDLLQNNCITIRAAGNPNLSLIDRVDSHSPMRPQIQSTGENQMFPLKQLTFQEEKDLDRLISLEEERSHGHKDILLSYVRAEAAQHAVRLKEKLTEMGYSVFLDVHEIKYGVDWQDALNHAVSNCEAFVPLVTPRYGETQWTNREVKLADVLSKFILPINYLDHWPPKCLAIQFATTQYIPWRSIVDVKADIEAGRCTSSTCYATWADFDIEEVASGIDVRLRAHDKQQKAFSTTQIKKKMSMLRSCPVALPEEFAQLSQHREGRPLIVISLHPQQRSFGDDLRQLLELEGFEVWCSTDIHSEVSTDEDSKSDQPLFSQESFKGCGMGHGHPVLLSQLSQLSQPAEEDPVKRDICLKFQEKADEAGLVIFVLSLDFAQSRTSQMQVFYCEHRKRVIPLRFEEFPMPGWISMLIGTGELEDANAIDYKGSLLNHVRHVLQNPKEDLDRVNECKLSREVSELKGKMPRETYVYISGGTKFFHKQTEAICKAVGQYLARLGTVHLVTGGFFGVGETIGRSYFEERQTMNEMPNIWHILPTRDEKDRSKQANQNEDKSFPSVDYGTTLFCGDSVRERENLASRAFDICIIVEGGPGAAHEAEQFAWNDRIVIPVKCTGGAAGGKFNVPEKIFELPPGISKTDWQVLAEKDSLPEEIGQSVANIVECAKKRLRVDSPTYGGNGQPNMMNSEKSRTNGSALSSPTTPRPMSPRRRKLPMTRAPTVTFKKDKK